MLRTLSRAFEFQNNIFRNFHRSAVSRLREITVEKKDEKTTVIDCKYTKSPREPYIIKFKEESDKCVLCRLQLNLKYTDVLILNQFLDIQGRVLKFHETSLCKDQYKLVKELIYMAQYAGLLPEPPSAEPKKPYLLLNTYYDETTINLRPKRKPRHIRLFYLQKKLGPAEKFRINPNAGTYYGPRLC